MRGPKSETRRVRAARIDDAWLARLDSFAPDAQLLWPDEQAQLLLEHVWWRDLGRCGICGEELSLVGAELDWIVPAALGKMDLAAGTAYVGTTFQSRRHRRQNLQAVHPPCVEIKLGVWEIAQWRSRFMPLTDVAEGLFAAGSLWLPVYPVELPDSMAVDLERQRQRNWEQYIKQRARIQNYSPQASRGRRGVARIVDMLVAFTIASLLPSWEALDNVLDEVHYGLILAGVWVLYEWPQTALWGRTFGKRLTGIRIMRVAGEGPIGWTRTALRLVLPAMAVALLSWFGIAIAVLIYATCLLNSARRGLHDLISQSKVVED